MSTTHDTPQAGALDERAVYVQALRDLASFLESHPDVPVDDTDSLGPWLTYERMTPARAVEIAEALGGTAKVDGAYVTISRPFGPISYKVTLAAKDVCEERTELATVRVLPAGLRDREPVAA